MTNNIKPCVVKFMFDYGADSCIWQVNDAAKERFGYGLLNLEYFNLPANFHNELIGLCKEYNTILDWDVPQNGFIWTDEQIENFRQRAQAAYDKFVMYTADDITVENWIKISLSSE